MICSGVCLSNRKDERPEYSEAENLLRLILNI
jgi:hypothetical protein